MLQVDCGQSRFGLRLTIVGITAAMAFGCERAGSPTVPSVSSTVNVPANVAFCADEVNRYRSSVGRPPLRRSAELEAFAARAAEHDGLAHQPHYLFGITNGGGAASAETEILWWRGLGVRHVIQEGLHQMWQGGPSGEHYDIIVGAFSEVGCGIFVNGAEVTVAQDFR